MKLTKVCSSISSHIPNLKLFVQFVEIHYMWHFWHVTNTFPADNWQSIRFWLEKRSHCFPPNLFSADFLIWKFQNQFFCQKKCVKCLTLFRIDQHRGSQSDCFICLLITRQLEEEGLASVWYQLRFKYQGRCVLQVLTFKERTMWIVLQWWCDLQCISVQQQRVCSDVKRLMLIGIPPPQLLNFKDPPPPHHHH